jgi:hypothetical protein
MLVVFILLNITTWWQQTFSWKQSKIRPCINCNMHLSYFSFNQPQFGFAPTAVALRATIEIRTSSSPPPLLTTAMYNMGIATPCNQPTPQKKTDNPQLVADLVMTDAIFAVTDDQEGISAMAEFTMTDGHQVGHVSTVLPPVPGIIQ